MDKLKRTPKILGFILGFKVFCIFSIIWIKKKLGLFASKKEVERRLYQRGGMSLESVSYRVGKVEEEFEYLKKYADIILNTEKVNLKDCVCIVKSLLLKE